MAVGEGKSAILVIIVVREDHDIVGSTLPQYEVVDGLCRAETELEQIS